MTSTQTLRFENPGMGLSVAADWFLVNGRKYWISFMTQSEGRGKRRTWHVIASHYTGEGKPVKVSVSKVDCFRYEATDIALAELAAFLPVSGEINQVAA